MWDSIKSHPWLIGGAIGAVLLLYLYSNSGGSTATAATGVDPNADALAAAQLGAATTVSGQQAGLTALTTQTQGALDLARIQADTTDATNGLAAQVALSQIGEAAHVADLSAQTTQQANQLQTTIATGQQNEQEALAAIQSNTTIQNTSILSAALTQNAQIAAGVESQAIAGQTQIGLQNAQNNAPSKGITLPFGLGTIKW